MNNYFRAQTKNSSFEQLQNHISADGGDGLEEQGGVCACLTITEMLRNTVLDVLEEDDEIVIFEGYEICEIYDGYRVQPIREIARMTIREFKANPPTEFETL